MPYGAGNPDAAVRLFCFSFAGGGASVYARWPHSFPADIAVCPVLLPGREGAFAQLPFDRLDLLLDRLVADIGPMFDRPYALFGYSLGARIAYALAHRLVRQGYAPPVHLTVAAAYAPSVPPFRRGVHLLPRPALLEHLRHLGGTPPEVLADQELVDLILPAVRADFALVECPLPLEPLACPITACVGDDDTSATPDLAAGWARQTGAGFRLRRFAGGHFFIREQVRALIAGTVSDITEAMADATIARTGDMKWKYKPQEAS
ncbi:thioesterase II family protein, partial [Azospirillum sp. B506]|uniref:thioesterase II family protein n=1 Tax=Azospirillum sp. B506 TaxID=137721 RepID=UPI000678EB5A